MTPYDDLKARAQKAIDNDDWGTLKALFVSASPIQAVTTFTAQDTGGPHSPPPPPPNG